jgi:two-component system, chemotaxis family, chemotaxis protein CheY
MDINILIADGSPVSRAVIARTVKMARIPAQSVFEAENGAEALRILESNKIDIVISAINMPEMDGMRLMEIMREKGLIPSIPVIIITSVQNESETRTIKAKGASACIKKPFTPETIRETINAFLKLQGEEK